MKKKLKNKIQEISLTFALLSSAYQNIFRWWYEEKFAAKDPKDFTENELNEILNKVQELYNEYKTRENIWKRGN
jgi:hypothetical protein